LEKLGNLPHNRGGEFKSTPNEIDLNLLQNFAYLHNPSRLTGHQCIEIGIVAGTAPRPGTAYGGCAQIVAAQHERLDKFDQAVGLGGGTPKASRLSGPGL
jgi:hypothetical protein